MALVIGAETKMFLLRSFSRRPLRPPLPISSAHTPCSTLLARLSSVLNSFVTRAPNGLRPGLKKLIFFLLHPPPDSPSTFAAAETLQQKDSFHGSLLSLLLLLLLLRFYSSEKSLESVFCGGRRRAGANVDCSQQNESNI